MKAKAAAVEATGRMFETERLTCLYRVGVLLKSLQRMKSKLMQKQFLTLAVSPCIKPSNAQSSCYHFCQHQKQ